MDRLVPVCTHLLDAAAGEIEPHVHAYELICGIGNPSIGADNPRDDPRRMVQLVLTGLRQHKNRSEAATAPRFSRTVRSGTARRSQSESTMLLNPSATVVPVTRHFDAGVVLVGLVAAAVGGCTSSPAGGSWRGEGAGCGCDTRVTVLARDLVDVDRPDGCEVTQERSPAPTPASACGSSVGRRRRRRCRSTTCNPQVRHADDGRVGDHTVNGMPPMHERAWPDLARQGTVVQDARKPTPSGGTCFTAGDSRDSSTCTG